MSKLMRVVTVGLLTTAAGVVAHARDAKPSATKPAAAPPAKKTAQIKKTARPAAKRPAEHEVSLDGVLESTGMTEVALAPRAWSSFVVIEAVAPGTRVRKGDKLVRLDTEKIDQELGDLKLSRELDLRAIREAEIELRVLEQTTPLDLEVAQRAQRTADEDLKYFIEVDAPLSEESAGQAIKRAEGSLENAEEELEQLEQMYQADDLTEETEEIVLRRARRSVEYARFYLESTRIRSEHTIRTELPRKKVTLTAQARRAELTLDQTAKTLPVELEKKRLAFEKTKLDRKKADERLEKLVADRKAMDVKAPADGVVYYGQCTNGQWPDLATAAKPLKRGGTLAAHQVFMTIVQPRALAVRVNVPEDQLRFVRVGLAGTVTPKAYPDAKLSAAVVYVSPLPVSKGTFQATFLIDLADGDLPRLVPGMSGTVTIATRDKH